MTVEEINLAVEALPSNHKERVSDGFHTFYELYQERLSFNAALFNEWAKHMERFGVADGPQHFKPRYDVHKSLRHHDGELCFGGGWFIVVAVLPTGQISNHYPEAEWDRFNIPVEPTAKYAFDGHTATDCIERLKKLML